MNPLLDGLVVLQTHLGDVAVFLIGVAGAGCWCARLVSRPGAARAWLLLSPGLGYAALSLAAFAFVLLERIWRGALTAGSALLLILAGVGLLLEAVRWRGEARAVPRPALLTLAALGFFLLLLVRLAFLRPLLLPPYNDSPEHYMVVQDFLDPGGAAQAYYALGGESGRYYHLGFHSLAAWLVSLSGADVAPTLILLGQLSLVLLPVSLLGLTLVATGDLRAAGLAALLAAIGWKMPAFAANWGKYPALAAIVALPSVLAVWLLFLGAAARKRLGLVAAILLSISATFLHTRLAILLLLAAASGFLVSRMRFPEQMPLWKALLLTLASLPAFALLQRPLLRMYSDGWYLLLGLVVACLPFGFQRFARLSLAVSLYMTGMALASNLRLPEFMRGYSTVLLDRTFLEISLSIPLSVLGGAGLAGLIRRLPAKLALQYVLPGLLLVFIFFNALNSGSYYPDACCDYVQAGDLAALRWIAEQTPEEAAIVISAFETRNYLIGTDAGIWVRALTGRNANKRPYDLDWGSPQALWEICAPGLRDVYVYVGAMEFSFEPDGFSRPDWYELVFAADGTRIFRLLACD